MLVAAAAIRRFLKFTYSPPSHSFSSFHPLSFLPSQKALCFPFPWMSRYHFLLSFSLSLPLVIPQVFTLDDENQAKGSSVCLAHFHPCRFPEPVSLTIINLDWNVSLYVRELLSNICNSVATFTTWKHNIVLMTSQQNLRKVVLYCGHCGQQWQLEHHIWCLNGTIYNLNQPK